MSDEAKSDSPVSSDQPTERRRLRRRKTFRPIRVRPAVPGDADFDEVTGTVDAHREGLYFASERKSYKKGMRLFVTMPYSPHSQGTEGEYIGEVVRVDTLSDGKIGVAVHLIQSMNLK